MLNVNTNAMEGVSSRKRKAAFDGEVEEPMLVENGTEETSPARVPEKVGDSVPVPVPQDTDDSPPKAMPLEDVEKKEAKDNAPSNPYDNLRYCIVVNDGQHDSLVKLIGLKSLFAKQLPKMPRSYIARLVFDRRHTSLAILSDDPRHKGTDEEIIGAICYRGFREMRFAEIAFCAVNATHQVKGYGTKLMNLLKRHAVTEGVEYFITYADNYAIGYFKKQGFTKVSFRHSVSPKRFGLVFLILRVCRQSISMPKGRYNGLIKDYDGGTMME
jgi:histone acetyltransferase